MWEKIKQTEALHTGVNSAVVFTGTGTDDMTVSGSSWFAPTRTYWVVADGAGTYKWSNDGGSTWEKTLQVMTAGEFVELVNADGEKEGIKIRFGSSSGHVVNDKWAFTTTGQVVPTSATLLGSGQVSQNAEAIVLKGEYAKGTEDGLQIYITLPLCKNGTVEYRPSRPAASGGVLVHYPEVFELSASANFSYTYETNGCEFYKVYAVRKGSTACSGTFTLLHEQNRGM